MLCSAVIKTALQHLGVLNPSEEAQAEQSVAGLAALQALYDHLVEAGTFGDLTDVLITDAYEAGENERVAYSGVGTASITLPTTIDDIETGETRAPKDLALVQIAGTGNYVYDAPGGDWRLMSGLALTDFAPLADRFNVAALLAANWPFYTRYLTPPVERMASKAMLAMASRRTLQRTAEIAFY